MIYLQVQIYQYTVLGSGWSPWGWDSMKTHCMLMVLMIQIFWLVKTTVLDMFIYPTLVVFEQSICVDWLNFCCITVIDQNIDSVYQ